MCHPCSGDMWHVHTHDVAGPYNPYDMWLLCGRYKWKTSGRIDDRHVAMYSANEKVPHGPDMGCHVATIDWLNLLQNWLNSMSFKHSTSHWAKLWQVWASEFARICDLLCMVSNLYLSLIIIYVGRGKRWG
jgi:hypothetical protein